jgi:phosphoadenosine phosphosulfate reductase
MAGASFILRSSQLIERSVTPSKPREILGWAVGTFGSELAAACSFGGLTGMAVLDMLVSIDRSIPVYYLDTGLLFPETYEHIRTVTAYYGITPIAVQPALSVKQQNSEYGAALWERDPDACCELRKVAPQREFLQSYRAWVTGLRRDQSPSRKDVEAVEYDAKFNLTKISPFAAWTEQQVREYIRERGVPYNPLLERGYASVGCIPCTRAIHAGEDPRAGRWSGSLKTECGLHV